MAVKVYSHNSSPPAVLSHLLGRQNKHLVNVIRILNGPPACVCMELCAQDLKGFLHRTPFPPLPHAEVNRVGREIVEGLLELKAMRLMHGDVKP
jgi:serine/threonine protein kinase